LVERVRLLDDHAFEQRKATIIAILAGVGDLDIDDSGRRGPERRFAVRVDAPGDGYPSRALFDYHEWFVKGGDGWRIDRYHYDFIDRVDRGRLAFHLHELGPGRRRAHVHCEPAARMPSISHFRAYEVDLLEAHDDFLGLFASETPIDCTGLRPLRSDD
jgi:hypothetical protein